MRIYSRKLYYKTQFLLPYVPLPPRPTAQRRSLIPAVCVLDIFYFISSLLGLRGFSFSFWDVFRYSGIDGIPPWPVKHPIPSSSISSPDRTDGKSKKRFPLMGCGSGCCSVYVVVSWPVQNPWPKQFQFHQVTDVIRYTKLCVCVAGMTRWKTTYGQTGPVFRICEIWSSFIPNPDHVAAAVELLCSCVRYINWGRISSDIPNEWTEKGHSVRSFTLAPFAYHHQ